MDTSLTEAQETFVEAWSPERVLETSRTMRQLVLILQHLTRTHRNDTDMDEALTLLAALPGLEPAAALKLAIASKHGR